VKNNVVLCLVILIVLCVLFCVPYCYRYISVRYSRYDKSYLPPTFRKEDLLEPLDEADPRRFQPIKAAEIDQSSLTSYDALVT